VDLNGVKNPLNPVIGETFSCMWNHTDGSRSYYFAEQISHHPPISAFMLYNKTHRFVLNATIRPQYVKFWGNSAESIMHGNLDLHLFLPDGGHEIYRFTYPNYYVSGIFIGKLTLQICGKVTISCPQTNYSAEIEFKTKGLLRGDYNSLEGTIYKDKQKLAQLEGNWSSQLFLIDLTKKKKTLLEISTEAESPQILPSLDEAPPTDSRKVWGKVFEGISSGNDSEALVSKLEVERIQRERSHQRKSSHSPHQQQFFHLDTKHTNNGIQHEKSHPKQTTKDNSRQQEYSHSDEDDDHQSHDLEDDEDAVSGFYLHNDFLNICREIQENVKKEG